VLWGAYGAGQAPEQLFRVAEDGTLADAQDSAWSLPQGASVGLPHPLDLTAEQREQFARVFGDYELLQPFEQLGRSTHAPTTEELEGSSLASLHGLAVAAPKLVFGLEQRQWVRGLAGDGGSFDNHTRRFGDVEAQVRYSGAVAMGYIDEKEKLTVEAVEFFAAGAQEPLPLAKVDRIVTSEVLRDLRAVCT